MRQASPPLPQTSYWLGEANEMVAVKTILIIVNGGPGRPKRVHNALKNHHFAVK
jgi:hypothetical protein